MRTFWHIMRFLAALMAIAMFICIVIAMFIVPGLGAAFALTLVAVYVLGLVWKLTR